MPHLNKSERFNRALDKIMEGTKILNNEFNFPTTTTVKTNSGTQVYGPELFMEKCRAAYSCSCPHVCQCEAGDTKTWTDAFHQASLQLIKNQSRVLDDYTNRGNKIIFILISLLL